MVLSRREIVEEVLDFVGERGDANATATANALLNRAVMKLWLKHPWRVFRAQNPYTFATVANQAAYPMPTYFGRPNRRVVVRNLTTGGRLAWRDRSQIEIDDPAVGTSLVATGQPEACYEAGVCGVSVQPASASAYELLSDNAADTDVLVTLLGLDTNGVEVRAQYTLNGINAVACGTWTYFEEFSKAYPSTETAPATFTSSRGNVTLRKAAAGATAETLSPDESARQHPMVQLYRTPNAVWTIAIPFVRAPKKLRYDSDEIPFGWYPAIFEEMAIQWRTNRGDLTDDGSVPRPAFLDLIAEDNRSGPRPDVQPYSR